MKIKKLVYLTLSPFLELGALIIIVCSIFFQRFFFLKNKNSVFMGMMHINNWTYVAQAIRKRGYYVQVVPWMIPKHEENIILYDINLKQQHPFLYSNFIGQYFLSFWIFIWAIYKFEIFVLSFRNRLLDRTIWLKWFEIPLLHLAGKKVILNTYGGDVATPRLRKRPELKYSLYDGYLADPQYRAYNEKAIARNTRILEKQADFIISAIDHVDYLNRVDAYLHLRCIDTENIQPKFETNNKTPILIHAPNHRLVKGTEQIIAAVESLNKRGLQCDLRVIENTSNSKLLEIIKEADAVVDQLLLGTYARFSIEAMALGKPVFCYLRQDLYQFNPIWNDCPIINVNPDTIESVLEKFLKNSKKEQVNIGRKGRKYIETYHSLEYIGKRFDEIIQKVVNNGSN
ncbi:MAG: glycosyltransferase [Alphaproteobacteria bacterium]|nr:glycosyltransferase [Alphaproteobacteria bacterium]